MAPKRNRLTMVGIVDEVQTALHALLIERPQVWIADARVRMRDLPKANFDLACTFAEQGKWWDAIFRFRIAAYLQPAYPQVWYNLGCCYFRAGRIVQAQAALLKALQQNPGQPEAIFMLAAINPGALAPGQRPTRMPMSMVSDFFTSVAPVYDVDEAASHYQAGTVMHEVLRPLVRNPNPVLLDLACGTGIAARPWRLAATQIIGVDSTAVMLAMAAKATHAEKKLFDRLIEADVAQLPAEIADGSIDLVQLVNAAAFIGDLSGVLQGAARVLQPHGTVAITIEPHTSAAGYGIATGNGRFGHSVAYVVQAARDAGLALVKDVPVQLYPAVASHALIFSKGGQ